MSRTTFRYGFNSLARLRSADDCSTSECAAPHALGTTRGGRRGGRALPFAFITGSTPVLAGDKGQHARGVPELAGSASLTLDELRSFARNASLGEDWALAFFREAKSAVGRATKTKQEPRRQEEDAIAVRCPRHKQVVLQQFAAFASSHEKALELAFKAMDADSDGVLSRDEAQAGLATLVIACPMSGCIFKASKANRGRIRRVIEQSQPQRVAYDLTAFREAYLNLPKDAYCLAEYFAPPSSAERCDTGSCVVNHHDVQHKRASPWGHLLAGAASGAVSRTITAPLETLRLHAMAGSGRSLPEVARGLFAEGGWRRFFRGNLMNVLRAAPQKALDFCVYDAALEWVTRTGRELQRRRGAGAVASVGPGAGGAVEQGEPSVGQTLLAAGLAGACSNVVLYPLEVIRARLTVGDAGKYAGIIHAARTVFREEGVRGFYAGVVPSVAAILPEAAITYGVFDLLKRQWRASTGSDVGVSQAVTFGAAAALTGQFVAYPLETIARRMQVQAMRAGPHAAESLWVVVARMVREEGLVSLYRGLAPASLRVLPMALVSFGTYEVVRSALADYEARTSSQAGRRRAAPRARAPPRRGPGPQDGLIPLPPRRVAVAA